MDSPSLVAAERTQARDLSRKHPGDPVPGASIYVSAGGASRLPLRRILSSIPFIVPRNPPMKYISTTATVVCGMTIFAASAVAQNFDAAAEAKWAKVEIVHFELVG